MATIDNSLFTKIQKLLRLSESPNQHEAELALSKARALAVQHDIDIASINVKEEKKNETVEHNSINVGQRVSVASHYAGWIVESHFNSKIIYCGSRQNGRKIMFIGTTSDIQISQYVYEFLTETMMRLWREYQLETGADTKGSRSSWLYGFYQGLGFKLKTAKEQAEKEKFNTIDPTQAEEVKNNYALMVINKKDLIKRKTEELFPKLKSWNKKFNFNDSSAFSEGYETGKTIELNKGIAGRQVQKLT